MSTHVRIGKINPRHRKGEGPIGYVRRVKYLQVHAELTALKASMILDGGRTEAKLRGEAR